MYTNTPIYVYMSVYINMITIEEVTSLRGSRGLQDSWGGMRAVEVMCILFMYESYKMILIGKDLAHLK